MSSSSVPLHASNGFPKRPVFRPYTQKLPAQHRWLVQFRFLIFIIEGGIGAGKTTLGNALVRLFTKRGIKVAFIPERIPVDLLNQFINFKASHPEGTPNPYAFPLQMGFLKHRIEAYREALALAEQGYVVFVDRSLPGDYVLARANRGDFTDEEWVKYEAGIVEADLVEPAAVVFLDPSLDSTVARIRTRDRTNESKYAPEYLQRVMDGYREVFEELPYPMVTLPWDKARNFDNEAESEAACLGVLKELKHVMRVDQDFYRVRAIV